MSELTNPELDPNLDQSLDPAKEYLTWERYGQACREMAEVIAADDFRPDIILAIARGGLFFAGSLGYALSVKNIYTMNVEYYTGEDERLDVPVVLPPYLELVDLEDSRVLVVDDVADTGHTLKLVRDFCKDNVGHVRTAVLYEKDRSVVKCDYIWQRCNLWIEFPWSVDKPVIAPAPRNSRKRKVANAVG